MVSRNSAASYFSLFRGVLKLAYRDKYLRENPNDFLEKIESRDIHKEFLTQDELKTLASTPCDIPVLRNASLFSCLTGLRISDILNLKWENLCTAPDLGHCIRLRTQKTQTEALLPISYEAYALCGEPGTGKVFKELRCCMTGYPLKAWIKKAGIQKHITFHCFKHTFAIDKFLKVQINDMPFMIFFTAYFFKIYHKVGSHFVSVHKSKFFIDYSLLSAASDKFGFS